MDPSAATGANACFSNGFITGEKSDKERLSMSAVMPHLQPRFIQGGVFSCPHYKANLLKTCRTWS